MSVCVCVSVYLPVYRFVHRALCESVYVCLQVGLCAQKSLCECVCLSLWPGLGTGSGFPAGVGG